MNKSSAALLIDLTRSPSPKSIQTPSSPRLEIPSVFQQLRARKLRRLNPSLPPDPDPSNKRARHTQETNSTNHPLLSKHSQLHQLLQPRDNNSSPDQITLCSDPIDLTLDDVNFESIQNPATLHNRRPRQLTTRLSPLTRCSEPIDLTLDEEDSVTTQNNQPAPQPSSVVQDVNPPVSLRESSPESSSSSSTCDDEIVESILLERPPLISDRPKSPPPLRFLPSDLKLLNVYLCKPISRVLTTCSSIIIPPKPIPGFPLDHLEKKYRQDDWRIRRETITGPGSSSRNVDCWISGFGWPAKSFIICGWLVGIDRRERFLSYYIDDGTAVLECQVLISQLNKVFDLSSETTSKTTAKDEKNLAGAADEPSVDRPPAKPKADPRLDAYRRLPSPARKSHVSSTKSGTKDQPQLEKKPKEENVVTEEMIWKYSNLEIGTTLKVIGQPKELFKNSKRILDLDEVFILHENLNFGHDHDEEIRFRNQLKEYRHRIYSQPFRLSNAWPESIQLLNDQNPQKQDAVNPPDERSQRPKVKETKRLKLVPISKLQPNQINFANYLNYLTHHIITKYDTDDTSLKKVVNFDDLKEKVLSKSTQDVKLFDEFFVQDIFDGDKNHDGGIKELNLFIETLIQQQQQTSQIEEKEEKRRKEKSQSKSIFLTDQEDYKKRGKMTREGIIRRSMQELIHQGTIIISPFNEAGFTVPNVYSLGPKIIQILRDHSPSSNPSTVVSSKLILSHLKRDQLWKFLDLNHVENSLIKLGFHRHHLLDTWSLL